jgi:hypothetical protein
MVGGELEVDSGHPKTFEYPCNTTNTSARQLAPDRHPLGRIPMHAAAAGANAARYSHVTRASVSGAQNIRRLSIAAYLYSGV